MTKRWLSSQANREDGSQCSNKLRNAVALSKETLSAEDLRRSYHDEKIGILGCKHYQRIAKLQAHCCGRWFPCRFCHDEISDHQITRNLTTTMLCMECETVQPCAQYCRNPACSKKISKYYCDICKLWDNDKKKDIYRKFSYLDVPDCNECGICRVGKGLGKDYFHCKKCNVCMTVALKNRHKCIERNLESDCPICGEYMFTSTTTGKCFLHNTF